MDYDSIEEQSKILAEQWEKLLQSNKLNICTKKLEGTTVLEVNILKIVEKNPDIILREISALLTIPSSTLTSAVNRLERRQLLKRIISERDLRSFGLALTEEGKQAIDEHYKEEQILINSMLQVFEDSKERNNFITLFKKLVDNII
jgi:DNA-binding MarR family transcriptional regulator